MISDPVPSVTGQALTLTLNLTLTHSVAQKEYIDNIQKLWRHLLNAVKTLTRPQWVLGLVRVFSPVGWADF